MIATSCSSALAAPDDGLAHVAGDEQQRQQLQQPPELSQLKR